MKLKASNIGNSLVNRELGLAPFNLGALFKGEKGWKSPVAFHVLYKHMLGYTHL
jgi:hypothetical protein